MTSIYRIHATDNSGPFSIDCFDYEEYRETYDRFKEDSEVDQIWVEEYDEEEGWQAC